MKSAYNPYSSFTDPYLTIYFQDEKRLKQLRKFGLITKKNEVYPETVYQANITKAERKHNAAALKHQSEVREELYKHHKALHDRLSKQEQQQKVRRAESAKASANSRIFPNIRLPDCTTWTKKDFVMNGFDYYPDYCRPKTASSADWFRLGRSNSNARSNTFSKSPYLDWPPQPTKLPEESTSSASRPPTVPTISRISSFDDETNFLFFKDSVPLDLLDDNF